MKKKQFIHTTQEHESLGGATDAEMAELFFGKRHRYMSKAWREAYGATLTRAEVRLVQGFRGLERQTQETVLASVAGLVLGGGRASLLQAVRRVLRSMGNRADNLHNVQAWVREADRAARAGMPVQIPGGGR